MSKRRLVTVQGFPCMPAPPFILLVIRIFAQLKYLRVSNSLQVCEFEPRLSTLSFQNIILSTMKFSVFLAASSASLALAVPASSIQKRADFCDQWGSQVNGAYTTYNNLWGKADATSGSQCTGVDGLSGNTLKWHTSWSWAGGFVTPLLIRISIMCLTIPTVREKSNPLPT